MAQVLEGGRSLLLWVLALGHRKSAGLAGLLVGWLVGRLGWLAGRAVGRLVDGLLGVVSWLVDCDWAGVMSSRLWFRQVLCREPNV